MKFEKGNIYHVYNRGNNKGTVFFQSRNYWYFLGKVERYLKPACDILAYCLMPNHFHLLIRANDHTVSKLPKGKICTNPFSEGVRIVLSSYTRAIHVQEGRVGSLFTQNTRAKLVQDRTGQVNYGEICFHYIHQNPVRAGLTQKAAEWPYSSYRDYTKQRKSYLCQNSLAVELLEISRLDITPGDHLGQMEEELSALF